MMNPTLADLIGGIQSVTLSDEEARRRGTQKSILERKAPPTFDTIIEIVDRDQVAVHNDVASTVDLILRGGVPRPELRRREEDGEVAITAAPRPRRRPTARNGRGAGRGTPRDPGMYNGSCRARTGTWDGPATSAPLGHCLPSAETARHGGASASHLRVRGKPQSIGARHRSLAGTCDSRARRARGGYRPHLEELLPATSAADS